MNLTSTDSVSQSIKHYLIVIYNNMVDLMTPPENDFFGQILFNTYFSTGLFTFITIAVIFLFERQVYRERKLSVEEEMRKEELGKGYPIDAALIQLHNWRKENGV
jgi:hypothetical protein